MARKQFSPDEMDRFLRLIERRRAALNLKAEFFYEKAGISERTFMKAKADGHMTEATYEKLLRAMEVDDKSEEIRRGVFQDKDVSEHRKFSEPHELKHRIFRSLPVLVTSALGFLAVLILAGTCTLTDVCRPLATSAYNEFTDDQILVFYSVDVVHRGGSTNKSFVGPAIMMPERPSLHWDSDLRLSGPADISIAIFDRNTETLLQPYELEGDLSEYREPYYDDKIVLRSLDIEIVECLAFLNKKRQTWIKTFRVLHPDAQRLDEQVTQEKRGNVNLIEVYSGETVFSSKPLSCESDPRMEEEYGNFEKSGSGEKLINFDPNSAQPRKLSDIGYALQGWYNHCITLHADNFEKSSKYIQLYEIIFRDSLGNIVRSDAICFHGEDRFTVEFKPINDGTELLRPFTVEGLFNQAVERRISANLNRPGGRESLLTCAPDFCALKRDAVQCYTIPPILTVSNANGRIFSAVLPNCAEENPLPSFRCYEQGGKTIDVNELSSWVIKLEYNSGNQNSLRALPAGFDNFIPEHRIDFPC